MVSILKERGEKISADYQAGIVVDASGEVVHNGIITNEVKQKIATGEWKIRLLF